MVSSVEGSLWQLTLSLSGVDQKKASDGVGEGKMRIITGNTEKTVFEPLLSYAQIGFAIAIQIGLWLLNLEGRPVVKI